MRRLILIAALVLSACAGKAGLGGMSVGQSLYASANTYGSVVHQARLYAEGPTADPKVVHRIRTTITAKQTVAAVNYGKAYVACMIAQNQPPEGINCLLFDFSEKNARGYAITLRSAIVALEKR